MGVFSNIKNLFIPNKNMGQIAQPGYGTDMRTIENWASQVLAALMDLGGITEITSTDGTVTVTDPFGPVVDLSAHASGGGYVSLTGPGESTSPGDLTQVGNLIIDHLYALETDTIESISGAGVAISVAGNTLLSISDVFGLLEASIGQPGSTTEMDGGVITIFAEDASGGAGTITFFLKDKTVSTNRAMKMDYDGSSHVAIGFYDATPVRQPAAITPPTGGTTVDIQARTAIGSLIDILSAAAGGNGITA